MTDEVTLALLARDERIAELVLVVEGYRKKASNTPAYVAVEALRNIVERFDALPSGHQARQAVLGIGRAREALAFFSDERRPKGASYDSLKCKHPQTTTCAAPGGQFSMCLDCLTITQVMPDVPLINEGKTTVPELPHADDSEGGHCD